jgi:L-threonylcarbamoyladenylate synthase
VTPVYSLNDPTQRSEGFAEAKESLASGALVVMPTDTVYGLAADAFDAAAVRRLLRAKGRGRDMPTPVMVGSIDTMRALATNLSAETRELARVMWPGALTIICRQQPSLRWDIGDSRGTVALRVPAHDDAIELLLDNGPLAVSSANTTGMSPATTVQEAQEMLGETVDVYLDAGPTPGPVPSTIVDATGDVLRVVRLGVITLEQLREIVPSIEGPDDSEPPEVFEGFATPEYDEAAELDLGYDEQDVADHAGGEEPAEDEPAEDEPVEHEPAAAEAAELDLGYDEQDIVDHAGGEEPAGGVEPASGEEPAGGEESASGDPDEDRPPRPD